ncbi:MAG: valine--tRNA ligase [Alphaproteobacteria bacterium]|nr:valine--tRNA ligase [Alphaproteobacteria bacterium]
MLEKTYRPDQVEAKHYAEWESSGAFACHAESNAEPYTIIMPPPNVTGSLHVGHSLTFTVQDVLIRYRRMRGRDTLWQPGTDHAGIATQMVVERELAKEGKSRQEMGREKFLERVWAWKAESGGTILRQLRRLGASADWEREVFTMDEGPNAAVRKVFVDLYKQGLIYKAKRLVNWDPKLKTAISDLEVEQTEVKGHLWHLKYPIEGEEGRFIVVATTRPETMLGDTGVAVHPDDARYKDLVGKHAILPLVGRKLPIVADEYSDPEKGTGAVKMTPAHDFNDFEVGKRHNLELVNIMDENAHLNANVPKAYVGMERFAARKKIVADLEALGLVEKIEPNTHMVPHGDRSGVPLEPFLSDQWYLDAATLAKPAIEAVETGKTRIVPKQFEAVYFEWMRNIQPWNISRQLWWGHQIPAWYGPDGKVFVELNEAEAHAAAKAHYNATVTLRRDSDVLDTWFSSGLWPFSTLGWPNETKELKRYYPGDALVTGADIIFFWVARMMMFGIHFMGEVPFRDIYLHGLVRDERGQKMSKTKGNVIDPLELIDAYGADALRFTIAASISQGRDIKLAKAKVESYRNFATKIWNAARFAEMNGCKPVAGFDPSSAKLTLNRWIATEIADLSAKVTASLDEYRLNEAAMGLYHGLWGTFCDWYLEFAKPVLTGSDRAAADETKATTAWALDALMHLLHPIMPFLTEEIHAQSGVGGKLITGEWPLPKDGWIDRKAQAELGWVVKLISEIRSVRSEMNVPPAAMLKLQVKDAGPETKQRLATHGELIRRLARVENPAEVAEIEKTAAQVVVDEATFALPLAGVIDLAAERTRLSKEIDKLSGEIGKIDAKLGNASFVAKAPSEVVEEQRERRAEADHALSKLRQALDRIRVA